MGVKTVGTGSEGTLSTGALVCIWTVGRVSLIEQGSVNMHEGVLIEKGIVRRLAPGGRDTFLWVSNF